MNGAKDELQSRSSDGRLRVQNFIAAVNHPLRVRILAELTNREASPVQLSRELAAEKGVCAYHCRKLDEWGLIEIVRERPVRGSTEHIYRATRRAWFDTEEWMSLDPAVRSVASAWTLDRLIEDAGAAVNAGTFDRRGDRHLSRSPIVLDERGWRRVSAILDETLEAILEESSASSGRMAESGEEGVATVVGMVSFEAAPPAPNRTVPPVD